MLVAFANTLTTQAVARTPPVERRFVTQFQEVRTLPGQLNQVPVFNSNSPEVITSEGLLLSTFPPQGKRFPNAHLNKALQGRFDFFSHHVARPRQGRNIYQGVIVSNPNAEPVIMNILQAASHASTDAPFIKLPAVVEDFFGRVFSGPGSRLMSDILRGRNKPEFTPVITIPPKQSQVLFTLPIPSYGTRSTFLRLQTDGEVYMAHMAMFNPIREVRRFKVSNKLSTWRSPILNDWLALLINGRLVEPRDRPPSLLPSSSEADRIYGRVAGVTLGSEWYARIVDPASEYLAIPESGKAFSYPLSTVTSGTLGTQQVQSAPMAVRYSDTALLGHGNYGVHYRLNLPLQNPTNSSQTVKILFQTPFKQRKVRDRLTFVEPPQGKVFFRGTLRLTYKEDNGFTNTRFLHLVQREGEQGKPLATLRLPPGDRRSVSVDFLYPPDATPPQVLTVQTSPS